MIFVNSLPIIKHRASMHACCKNWAVEAHEVALVEIGVATNVELRIDSFTTECTDLDGVLRPDGFAIIVWLRQPPYHWKLGRRGG